MTRFPRFGCCLFATVAPPLLAIAVPQAAAAAPAPLTVPRGAFSTEIEVAIEAAGYEGGSLQAAIDASCRPQLAERRTAELERLRRELVA